MSSWILSLKLVLISAGVVSVAMGLKLSVPVAVNGAPALWSVILSWMKPPYLYIIINGIIITIAATSRFHQTKSEPRPHDHFISVRAPPPPPPPQSFVSFQSQPDVSTVVEEYTSPPPPAEVVVSSDSAVELKPVMANGITSTVDVATKEEFVVEAEVEADDVVVDSTLTYNTLPQEISSPELQKEPLFPVREKPLVSSRFGHKKPNRTAPEVAGVKALRVARPKRQDTLESTWKTITEGRHVPLTRHLKKSDTFEHHSSPTAAPDHAPKSKTLKDRSNYIYHESPARIQKEASVGQDELNRRVEAFIKKFNEDMRIQRQESLNQYMEMINRGV